MDGVSIKERLPRSRFNNHFCVSRVDMHTVSLQSTLLRVETDWCFCCVFLLCFSPTNTGNPTPPPVSRTLCLDRRVLLSFSRDETGVFSLVCGLARPMLVHETHTYPPHGAARGGGGAADRGKCRFSSKFTEQQSFFLLDGFLCTLNPQVVDVLWCVTREIPGPPGAVYVGPLDAR